MQTKAGNLEPAHLMQRFARRPGRAAPLALPRGRGPAGSVRAVGVSVLRRQSAPCPVDLLTTPWPHTRKSGSVGPPTLFFIFELFRLFELLRLFK